MSRGPDAGTLLARALLHDAAAAGCAISLQEASATRWASATFVGARHWLTLLGDAGDSLEGWLAQLPEADLPLRRHLVADLLVLSVLRDGDTATVEIEALTVEE